MELAQNECGNNSAPEEDGLHTAKLLGNQLNRTTAQAAMPKKSSRCC
jgi:hypothetical protein